MVCRNCFAPNCSTSTRRKGVVNEKCFTFVPPKDPELFQQWSKAVPRLDKQLSHNDRLCEVHFLPQDIIRSQQVAVIEGKPVFLPLNRPKLREGAIPCIWPNCPKYMSKSATTRKLPMERQSTETTKNHKTYQPDKEKLYQHLDPTSSHYEVPKDFPNIECSEVYLPEGWSELNNPIGGNENNVHTYCKAIRTPDFPYWEYEKSVVIDFSTAGIQYFVKRKQCDFVNLHVSLNSPNETSSRTTHCHYFSTLIRLFNEAKFCPGIVDSGFEKLDTHSVPTGEKKDGFWYSNKCELLEFDGEPCRECIELKVLLKNRLARLARRKKAYKQGSFLKRLTVKELHIRLANSEKEQKRLKSQVVRLCRRLKKLERETKQLRQDVANAKDDAVEEILQTLDPKIRKTVRVILKRAKAKNKKSMRYEAEWLLECLMLRIKSKAAYKHLRESGILPLPSQETLRKLISGLSCNFGFNKMALEAVENAFLNKIAAEKIVSLCLDEVSIQESIKFNAMNFCFDGFVELGEDDEDDEDGDEPEEEDDEEEEDEVEDEDTVIIEPTNEKTSPPVFDIPIDEPSEKQDSTKSDAEEGSPKNRPPLLKKKLANHALVFMIRSYLGNKIQPIGVFASCGAAPGKIIHRLLLKALILLDHHGVTVSSIVCDGAQPNKTAWKMAGIGCDDSGNIKNSMPHPVDPEKKVHFLLDPPHAFKCVRNQMLNNPFVQFAGKKVSWRTIKDLYETDCSSLGCLRSCPKLRWTHICPTSFQKMNVKLAVQVFSNSVASALKTFRNSKDPKISNKFQGSENLEYLIRILNSVFDIMNGRTRREAIRKEAKDPKYEWDNCKKVFQEFDDIIVATLNYYKQQTTQEKKKLKPFASLKTMIGLRVTMKSLIDIVNMLFTQFGDSFEYVLTGTLNQDCLEKFFGLIRAAGGCQDKPTCSSFLQLFRLLTLYYPTKSTVRGNIDNTEQLELISNYKTWLTTRFKDQEKRRKLAQKYTNDVLLDGIIVQLSEEAEVTSGVESDATLNDNIVYYICGYMARQQSKKNNAFQECQESLGNFAEVNNITAAELTKNKTYGKLTYASTNLYRLISKVEDVVLYFYETGAIFKPHSFYTILETIVIEKLPPVGCSGHQIALMANLINDYLLLRFNCIGRITGAAVCEASKSEKHKKMKMSRIISSKKNVVDVARRNVESVEDKENIPPVHTSYIRTYVNRKRKLELVNPTSNPKISKNT